MAAARLALGVERVASAPGLCKRGVVRLVTQRSRTSLSYQTRRTYSCMSSNTFSSSSSAQGEAASSERDAAAFESLKGNKVYLVSTQQPVDVTSLWGENDRIVIAFARELATQLERDVLPVLNSKGVKLYLVSIGTPERGIQFVEKTGFPADRLLADPDNVTYDALGFKKGIKETFFSWETPKAIWERIQRGLTGDLEALLPKWTKEGVWVPPKQDQAFQQGGVVIFQGKEQLWSHYDKATGAHADLKLLLQKATEGL